VSGAFSASFGNLDYESGQASSTTISVQPAGDYFVEHNLSVGGAIFFRYSNVVSAIYTQAKSVSDGFYVRLGYNLPIGDLVSLWPVVAIGAWETHHKLSAPENGYTSTVNGVRVDVGRSTELKETAVYAELYVPLLLHPASHFFLGIGPDMFVDLSHSAGTASNKRTFLGVSTTIGGWL
jgi:hypothetical protein